jgi:hypothetical protein
MTTGWLGVGIGVGIVVGVAAMLVVFCCVLPRLGAREQVKNREEESKREADTKSQPPSAASISQELISDRDSSPAGDKEGSSGGEVVSKRSKGLASSPAADLDEGSDQAPETTKGGKRGKAGKGAAKAKRGKQTAAAAGGEEPEVRVSCAAGTETSVPIPMTTTLWSRTAYRARFEPARKELWVSSAKGWIEAGASEYPFNLVYKPKGPQTMRTELIVSFGDSETVIPVLASTFEKASDESGGDKRDEKRDGKRAGKHDDKHDDKRDDKHDDKRRHRRRRAE